MKRTQSAWLSFPHQSRIQDSADPYEYFLKENQEGAQDHRPAPRVLQEVVQFPNSLKAGLHETTTPPVLVFRKRFNELHAI
jgi:hypothetical protein